MKKLLLTFLLIISSVVNADEPTYLGKGQSAPFNGILFTIEQSQDLRTKVLERDAFEKLNNSLEKSLGISEHNYQIESEKNQILDKRNDDLAKSLREARSTSDLEKVLYTGLGAAVIIFGAFIVKSVK
jgi:hypothetical protein